MKDKVGEKQMCTVKSRGVHFQIVYVREFGCQNVTLSLHNFRHELYIIGCVE